MLCVGCNIGILWALGLIFLPFISSLYLNVISYSTTNILVLYAMIKFHHRIFSLHIFTMCMGKSPSLKKIPASDSITLIALSGYEFIFSNSALGKNCMHIFFYPFLWYFLVFIVIIIQYFSLAYFLIITKYLMVLECRPLIFDYFCFQVGQ